MDVSAESDAAHLTPIPAPARRDPIEGTVEMQVLHEESFDSFIVIPLGDFLFEDVGATLMQYFVGLDVNAPRATARIHGALRLDGQHDVLLGEVPLGIEDTNARVVDGRDEIARLVFGLADVDDDFVADLQHRLDRRNDREVQLDRVPHQRESRQHVRCGTAGCTSGGRDRPRRADGHDCRARRSGLRPAPG